MLIGYARVSTQDQNPELQMDALEKAGCEEFFQEKMSVKFLLRTVLKRSDKKEVMLLCSIAIIPVL